MNTCFASYLRLRLDGHQIQLLGMDSGRFRTPETVEELLLAPGNRADLLVTTAAGNSTFTSVFYDRGGMPGMAGPAGRPPASGQGQGKLPWRLFRCPANRQALPRNSSTMDHPFHLHVWPMQIVEDRGKTLDSALWQDVVIVPANGQVKVRIAFKDFTGRTVYHCHILDHEDNGMMGVIEVR